MEKRALSGTDPVETTSSRYAQPCLLCSKFYPTLEQLHKSLIHPRVARMLHFVGSKNLPYSLEDVRLINSRCSVCARCKPNFFKVPSSKLVKATSPFERVSINFNDPLPTSPKGKQYILTIVDEYSRFPFAYPCQKITTSTVIRCLTHFFPFSECPHMFTQTAVRLSCLLNS